MKAWVKGRTKYGITVADYERMLGEQDGACASCKRPPSGKGVDAVLHVDHDHETGEARALLCGTCNKALGIMRDDPDAIWQLLIYARRHQKPKLRLVA
jgi:ribosomal protein L34E